MVGEKNTIEQRIYEGQGSFDSPFDKIAGIPTHEFTEQLWSDHGQEIIHGNTMYFSVGRFLYSLAGRPEEKEIAFQLHMEWTGLNPRFRPIHPSEPEIDEASKIRQAVDTGLILYRRFLSLHLRSFFAP